MRDVGSEVPTGDSGCFNAIFAADADVREWGADATGTNDSEPAFAAAATAAFANKLALTVPAGSFKLNSQLPVTFPSGSSFFVMRGQGVGSILTWPNGSGGISVNASAAAAATVSFRDMRLQTSQAGGGTALALPAPANSTTDPSEIFGITCQGSDGGLQTDYWSTCISLTSFKNVAMRHITVFGNNTSGGAGVGIALAGTSGNIQVVQNIDDLLTDAVQYGITTGDYTQGLAVTKFNCLGGTNCFNDLSTVTSGSNVQIQISNSQLAAHGDDVEITGAAQNVDISNNVPIYVASGYCGLKVNTAISGAGPYTFKGNQVSAASAGTGVCAVANPAGGNLIADNVFSNLATGIAISSGAVGWRVGYENYVATSAHLTDAALSPWPDTSFDGGQSVSTIGTTAGTYIGLAGSGTTKSIQQFAIAGPVRASGLNVSASVAQGGGDSMACTLRGQGASLNETVTLSNATGATDTTHSDLLTAAHNLVDLLCISGGTPTAANYTFSVQLNPIQ